MQTHKGRLKGQYKRRYIGRLLACAAILLAGAGCANVTPTQRGTLAKPEMQFDADIGHSRILLHTYSSKEGASGGQATGGGGCGCT